jgi:hypothetical protein
MKTTRVLLTALALVSTLGLTPSHANLLIYSNSFEVADGYADPDGGLTTAGPGILGRFVHLAKHEYGERRKLLTGV